MPLISEEKDVDAPGLMVPSAVWEATYKLKVSISHQGKVMECGSMLVQSAKSSDCDPESSSSCTIEKQGLF